LYYNRAEAKRTERPRVLRREFSKKDAAETDVSERKRSGVRFVRAGAAEHKQDAAKETLDPAGRADAVERGPDDPVTNFAGGGTAGERPAPRAFAAREPDGGDEEKKARMIAAALAEFATYGYKNANTNRIVKAAGVSKGLLFHYFGSKKELYLYLYDYTMHLVMDEAFATFDRSEKDIFKRWRAATEIKFDMMRRYGMLFEFILDAYARAADEVRDEIDASTMTWLATAWRMMRDSVDPTLFRDGLDTDKAIRVLYWTIEGYSKQWMTPPKPLSYYREHYDEMIEGLDAYIDLLRQLFYK
jgi:AcrR family transcriptional regulator